MTTTTAFLTVDHRHCDELWAEVESSAGDGQLAAARAAFEAFQAAMDRHLGFEEQTLFPAFEAAAGMPAGFGPTAVMRLEHEQMRRVLGQMAACSASGDLQGLLDHGDTLLMLIQQHNVKEEQMLYPMCDARLPGGWASVQGQWPAG